MRELKPRGKTSFKPVLQNETKKKKDTEMINRLKIESRKEL